jgi:hypothetical protein
MAEYQGPRAITNENQAEKQDENWTKTGEVS